MIIYAIPGLGTTEKLYVNTRIDNAEVVVLKWPTPEKNDTMKTYARKFLDQMDLSKPFCLLGVSFGGMLCTELSKITSPEKVFLVSTSKLRKELPWFIRAMKYIPIHKLLSETNHRKMAYQGRWFIGFGKAYIPEFLGMVDSMMENYFRHCIQIIATWDNRQMPQKAVHIHGNADKLLLYKCVSAHYTIQNGSHAMIMYHADEVNDIIAKELTSAWQ
jgi:hypothetical protein